jgi:hypothetical protein
MVFDSYKPVMEFKSGKLPLHTGRFGIFTKNIRISLHDITINSISQEE